MLRGQGASDDNAVCTNRSVDDIMFARNEQMYAMCSE